MAWAKSKDLLERLQLGSIVLYLVCLGWLPLDFRILTGLFMVAVVTLVRQRSESEFRWRQFPWDLCIVVPLLIHLVFHSFFQIELP